MRDLFPAFYRPSEEEFTHLWENALVVVDANVLLNLYRYPAAARADLLRLLTALSERLAVPYQAAVEFQRNRLTVIAGQKKRFDDVRKVLSDVEGQLIGELGKLKLQKRHTVINTDRFIQQINDSFRQFREELSSGEASQPDVFDHDVLREELDQLLTGKIGARPSQQDLDAIYTEGKIRFEHKRPPGFEDESKGKSDVPVYYSEGLRIERRFGDLVVWKQTLALVKAKQSKALIFITDDEKPDWWWTTESKGKKTIGPRPELIEEARSLGDLTHVYIYNSERFLEAANTHLKFGAKQESIDQITEVRESPSQRGISFYQALDQSIHTWLQSRVHLGKPVERSLVGFPDFIVTTDEGRFGYEIKILNARTLEDLTSGRLNVDLRVLDLTALCYIFVARSLTKLQGTKPELKKRLSSLTSDFVIVCGYATFGENNALPTFELDEILEGSGPSLRASSSIK